jgi:hypothetical protein
MTTVRVRLVRQLADDGFVDVTPATWQLVPDDERGYMQVVFDGTLTAEQVEAVTNRCESINANGEELLRRARGALQSNRNYLATPTPTQAQVVAQVAALTRQVNALIRFALGAFDGTE